MNPTTMMTQMTDKFPNLTPQELEMLPATLAYPLGRIEELDRCINRIHETIKTTEAQRRELLWGLQERCAHPPEFEIERPVKYFDGTLLRSYVYCRICGIYLRATDD